MGNLSTAAVVPRHVGFIVDGNRRWARRHGVPDFQGHRQGLFRALPEVVAAAYEAGVEEVSLWVFSTENWKRDAKEVRWLMNLIPSGTDVILPLAHRYKAAVRHIGRKDRVPARFLRHLERAEAETAAYRERRLNVCVDHGGQDEITRAVQALMAEGVAAADVTPALIASRLDSGGGLPLDLVVRTGGDKRLSGFLLWHSAYSELHFEEACFPDLTGVRVREIIAEFGRRERRFGGA